MVQVNINKFPHDKDRRQRHQMSSTCRREERKQCSMGRIGKVPNSRGECTSRKQDTMRINHGYFINNTLK